MHGLLCGMAMCCYKELEEEGKGIFHGIFGLNRDLLDLTEIAFFYPKMFSEKGHLILLENCV